MRDVFNTILMLASLLLGTNVDLVGVGDLDEVLAGTDPTVIDNLL